MTLSSTSLFIFLVVLKSSDYLKNVFSDYMVVSGLPEPLENPPPGYYAGEIAKFSLELMKNVKVELNKMDPDSDDVLWLKNLRIGFHSGKSRK